MRLFFCGKLLRRTSRDLNGIETEARPADQVYRRFSGVRRHRAVNGGAAVDRDSLKPPPVHHKDTLTKARLKEALRKNEFLQNFDEAYLDAFVMAMYLKDVPANTRLIQEGDVGSHLYVSEKGTFEIYQGPTYESCFGPGTAFGELALLYNTKRLRSVDVKHGGKVWVLEREAFQAAVLLENRSFANDDVEYLRKITIFRTLPNHTLAKINELMQVEFFQGDELIISQGEVANKFFVINGGSVQITRKRLKEDEKLQVLGKEEYFGEQAFSNDNEHSYEVNAVALPPGVECFTLEAKALLNYLGSLNLIKKDKWMFELKNRSNSQIAEWTSQYGDLKLLDIEVRGTLGVGAFGRVELVTIPSIPDKSFARKKIRKKKAVEMECEEYVLNEKKIMEYCNSPFICKLFQTFKDTKYVYFLMEVCLGGDLCTYVARNGPLDNNTAKFAMGCCVEAIAYLHSHGIVYRDLKPDNIMIDGQGYLKLVILFLYLKKKAVDYWSLGIVMHELLLGRPPFQDTEMLSLYSKITRGIESIGIYGNLKKYAENLIRSLLRPSPTDRIGNLKGGIADIRTHKWFGAFDWNALQSLNMPSPIVPKMKSYLDTKYFDVFDPEKGQAENEFSGWDSEF
ncbi:cGMP-dependent protein kinase, isozyme 1-like [Copidosoma floridanum]|uniref:cGMP-dependent protein kinase, isozyme 1-like n=1 Tax=Copidosoma floridanum TaxID=29053 RepID=UPI000C6F892E|nr:cGMP-dependent protein kinase, isozyme 1-like [Copidosoma floridanum]